MNHNIMYHNIMYYNNMYHNNMYHNIMYHNNMKWVTCTQIITLNHKTLTHIWPGERMKALICLQEEITPLQHCPSKLHLLPSYLMTSSPADLRARAKWTGANGASRQRLIHKIQGMVLGFSYVQQPWNLKVCLFKSLNSFFLYNVR